MNTSNVPKGKVSAARTGYFLMKDIDEGYSKKKKWVISEGTDERQGKTV